MSAAERRVVHASLPSETASSIDKITDLFTQLVALRRAGDPERARRILSKEAWLQTTDAGRAAYRKAVSTTLSEGYDAAQDHLTKQFLAYLRENGMYSPTHGEARASPPPSYVLGELIARAIELSLGRIETEARMEITALKRHAKNARAQAA